MAIPSSEAHLHKYVMGMMVMLKVSKSASQCTPTTIQNTYSYIGVILGLQRDNTPIMENQKEKYMEHDMETGIMLSHLGGYIPTYSTI